MSGVSAARHISRMDFPAATSAQIRSTISGPYFFDDPFGLAIMLTAATWMLSYHSFQPWYARCAGPTGTGRTSRSFSKRSVCCPTCDSRETEIRVTAPSKGRLRLSPASDRYGPRLARDEGHVMAKSFGTVLLVDDDDRFRCATTKALENAGFRWRRGA
jgi:hypothetical protein